MVTSGNGEVPEESRGASTARAAVQGNLAILARFAGRSDGSVTLPGETAHELERWRSDLPCGEE